MMLLHPDDSTNAGTGYNTVCVYYFEFLLPNNDYYHSFHMILHNLRLHYSSSGKQLQNKHDFKPWQLYSVRQLKHINLKTELSMVFGKLSGPQTLSNTQTT